MDAERLLRTLRDCSTWEEIGRILSIAPEEARAAVERLLRERVPPVEGTLRAPGVSATVTRDEWGVPHVSGATVPDAYFGLGFAMGQDRLWQLDFLRRLGRGTLAEVMGPGWVESDRISRTLNLRAVAEAGAAQITGPPREALEAFCGGVDLARVQAVRNGLPFEFALLEYEPEPWAPADSLVALRAFWWQLTGRFPILCLPEFARRILGEGRLFEVFLEPEGGDTTIWPREVPYPDLPRWDGGRYGEFHPHDSGAVGSNNWVVGPSRSRSGAPMLASDPHVPFSLPSVWYEAHVQASGLDACGACYAGVPGFFFGRNREVAWGLTNNISSLRDLYLEVTDDFDPLEYQRGGHWKRMELRTEVIRVRGGAPVTLEVREVDHGPVVSEILPGFARTGDVVSLRWVGREPTRELETMLEYAGAASVEAFRGCLEGWSCPTFNFTMADRQGNIGYQLTGKIPLRRTAARGYRPGNDPEHAWAGYVPFAALPALQDAPDDWLGSANNAVVSDLWPYPLSGTWPSDYRMQRLIERLEGTDLYSAEEMAGLQMDELSPRAREWVDTAAAALRGAGVEDPLLDELEIWDCCYREESLAACVFETFFAQWSREVLTHRLPAEMLAFAFPNAAGLVERLWTGDTAGWFAHGPERVAALRRAWHSALAWLDERLGPDRREWRWGALHALTLRHPLATTPALRDLLERGPLPHGGTWNTLNNSLYELDPLFATVTGVSYRLLVDLGGRTQSINSGGQSGHPGSPHYGDQLDRWRTGGYHPLELSPAAEGPVWRIIRGE